MVYPAACMRDGCPRLYTYTRDGREVMGCLDRVFWAEIDVERFRALQRTRAGFGALRVWRTPTARCETAVDQPLAHRPHGPCVNPSFLDGPALVTRPE